MTKITNQQQSILIAAITLAISLLCIGSVGFAITNRRTAGRPNSNTSTNLPNNSDNPESSTSVAETPFINLQSTVDQWLKSTNRQVGLVVYDLDNAKVAASYQPNRIFNAASIYKLFFAYDGYQQLTLNTIDGSQYFTTTEKGKLTYSDCLDYMVRESYNPCADPIRADQEAELRVDRLINRLNLTRTSDYGLYSSASDLTELLRLYWEHPDLAPKYWQQLADSMLNQPTTTYNWRQGLPSGFSNQVRVYDKVGWNWDSDDEIWSIYNDAAIIEFPTLDRHYTVVILTENTPNPNIIAKLGTSLEQAIFNF